MERLKIRDDCTDEKMRKHAAATRTMWAAVERARDAKPLITDGSAPRTVAESGTEGTMPLSNAAPIFDEYIGNLREDAADAVACRRRNVYSTHFDPLKDYLSNAIALPADRTRRPPLSLRLTPRNCHTLLYGDEL